jgi:hypothetical protein
MIAKIKGEKASTQMVLPVVMMLIAIMMMIITPAIVSVNI